MFKVTSPVYTVGPDHRLRAANEAEQGSVIAKIGSLAKKNVALGVLVTSIAAFAPTQSHAVDIMSMSPEESAAYFRSLAERDLTGGDITNQEQQYVDMTSMIREGRIDDYIGEMDLNSPTERPLGALVQQGEFEPFDLDKLEHVNLIVEGSFEQTVQDYNLDPRAVSAIRHVADWHVSVDDLMTGDQIDFMYSPERLDSSPLNSIHTLSIIETETQQRFTAIQHVDHKGEGSYFSPQGDPLRVDVVNPIAVDGDYRVSSPYGPRVHPVTGRNSFHAGVDLAYAEGEPRNGKLVQSSADGVVAGKGFDRAGGNYIMVDHPGGLRTVYMHLHRFAPDIKVGSEVIKGETLGGMGNTGRSTGPHLHLEFRVNVDGEWRHADPLTFPANDHAMAADAVASFVKARNYTMALIDPEFNTDSPISQVTLFNQERTDGALRAASTDSDRILETSSIDVSRQCEQVRSLLTPSCQGSWEDKANDMREAGPSHKFPSLS